MNVHLTPELEQLVHNKVESGRYNSASEVVCEALLLMKEKDQLRELQLGDFHRRLAQAVDEADRGDVVDGETFMHGMIEELDGLEAKRIAG